jgi:YVTN family beta-propeller protein
MQVATDPRVGSELLGFRLEALLGRGGMGVVYRAFDPRLKRNVAVKLIAPELSADARFRQRFLAESELAAALEHPNVVPVHDAGEVDGQLYLVMRHVEGRDLKSLLGDEGQLTPERTIAVCSQVAAALDAAHERGLVHRDVKPSNVLLDGREHVYLADFGLTRRLAEQAPRFEAGLSLGTPSYVAPEQIAGRELDGRADQYSLACLLYECLHGGPPFSRTSEAAVLFAHLEEEPPSLPGLEEVLRRGLAKDPGARYETCSELVEHAREALGVSEPGRSRRPVAAAFVAIALLAAALLVFLTTRDHGSAAVPQTGRLVRIDPETNGVENEVKIGNGPSAVAAGSGRVWVASFRDGSLWQLDPRTSALQRVDTVGRPFEVVIHNGSAFVGATGPTAFGGNVTKYDAVTAGKLDGLELLTCGIAGGDEGLWVAGCPNVQELSGGGPGASIRVLETIPIPYPSQLTAANFRESLVGIAAGEGGVWVLGDPADRRLWRIDPRRRRIVATIDLDFAPRSVVAGGGGIWVTAQLDDRVIRVDPKTYRVTASIPVGRGPVGVAFGAGSVWVANSIDRTIMRIDPATNRVVATVELSVSPEDVAAAGDGVWVAADAH